MSGFIRFAVLITMAYILLPASVFAAYSDSQIQQINRQIRHYESKQNYAAAARLYAVLIKDQPHILPNYIYLSLNQYRAKQPALAKKTLDRFIATNDLSGAPKEALETITELYKKINQELMRSSVKRTKSAQSARPNKTFFLYGVSTGATYNDNNNVASKEEAKKAFSTNVGLNAYVIGKKHQIARHQLYINQNALASFEPGFLRTEKEEQSISFSYGLQPKLKTNHAVLNQIELPLSLQYFRTKDLSVWVTKLGANFNLLEHQQIGYSYSQSKSKNTSFDVDLEAKSHKHQGYYGYRQKFDVWSSPAISAKARATFDTSFNGADLSLGVSFKPIKQLKLSTTYGLEGRLYPATESRDAKDRTISRWRFAASSQFSRHWDGSFNVSFKDQQASLASEVYKQGVYSLNLGWSN